MSSVLHRIRGHRNDGFEALPSPTDSRPSESDSRNKTSNCLPQPVASSKEVEVFCRVIGKDKREAGLYTRQISVSYKASCKKPNLGKALSELRKYFRKEVKEGTKKGLHTSFFNLDAADPKEYEILQLGIVQIFQDQDIVASFQN